jgi:ABC-2 type transport system ATP-binding protein
VRADSQVRWSEQGVPRTANTPDPSALVWELHQRFGGPVPDLEIRRPSLEESFLGLVTERNAA